MPAETSTSIVCDGCKEARTPQHSSWQGAVNYCIREGWLVETQPTMFYCPACKEKRKAEVR